MMNLRWVTDNATAIYLAIALLCIFLALGAMDDTTVTLRNRGEYYEVTDWSRAVYAVALLITSSVSLICSVIAMKATKNKDTEAA